VVIGVVAVFVLVVIIGLSVSASRSAKIQQEKQAREKAEQQRLAELRQAEEQRQAELRREAEEKRKDPISIVKDLYESSHLRWKVETYREWAALGVTQPDLNVQWKQFPASSLGDIVTPKDGYFVIASIGGIWYVRNDKVYCVNGAARDQTKWAPNPPPLYPYPNDSVFSIYEALEKLAR
jgi:type II secretory pathway pseudopilin PulG